ncbi:hypothetical protein PSNIH1_14585 [Pantoea sp. PSNIH1]|nr:hypothetical protein PSNIH1_14585 [Pantoea sp. PSNIH1]
MAFFEYRAKSALLPAAAKKPVQQPCVIKRTTNKQKPFSVTVKVEGQSVFVGEYRTEQDALEAQDQVFLVLHGDKATLNFPEKQHDTSFMRDFLQRKLRQKQSEQRDKGKTSL